MQYLLDTVTLVRHFSEKGKLGEQTARILDGLQESGDFCYVSVISLMEIMYLAEKNRIEINLSKTLDLIQASSQYSVIDLNPEILQVAETIDFPELHDRLILATAKWLGIGIISSDREFDKVSGIEVIWD
ncbi:MAG TPA: PIN domain-containing protein [Anaerolineales bacterium]|nr:PIN domain-containing protein [Anaerolineales bacterium]